MKEYEEIYNYIDRHLNGYIEEIRKFIRQPSVAHTGEGIKECSEMTLRFIKDLGAEDAKLVPLKDGHPVVYGKLRSRNPKAKTLLLYSHYDACPVPENTVEQWAVPPYSAEIVDPEIIGLPSKIGKVIVGRGAHDKKGPLRSFLLSLEAMLESSGDIPVNVIFCIEGEEENGSPHLIQFREKYLGELKRADAVLNAAYRIQEDGRLLMYRGYKGIVCLELTIQGGEWGGRTDGKDLWSGHFNWIDAPLVRLIRALNTMLGADDRVLIEGFYDNVRPQDDEEKEQLEKIKESFDEELWKNRLKINKFKLGLPSKELIERYIMEPMLNIDGIISGYTGPGLFTTLPMKAMAKIDVRIVPNMTSKDVVSKIRKHLDKHGFPEVKINVIEAGGWSRTSIKEDINKAAIIAVEKHGIDYIVWPTQPACNPSYLWNRPPLNLPVGFAGLGHGENFHRANEYIAVDSINEGIKYYVTYLHEYAKI